MIISVDFDGVIARGEFPLIKGEYPNAKDSIGVLRAEGHYIIVNTCRCGTNLLDAINWMAERGIVYDRINDNHPDNILRYGGNCRKIYAHCYIDDKNLGGFLGWAISIDMIRELEDEYNRKRNTAI